MQTSFEAPHFTKTIYGDRFNICITRIISTVAGLYKWNLSCFIESEHPAAAAVKKEFLTPMFDFGPFENTKPCFTESGIRFGKNYYFTCSETIEIPDEIMEDTGVLFELLNHPRYAEGPVVVENLPHKSIHLPSENSCYRIKYLCEECGKLVFRRAFWNFHKNQFIKEYKNLRCCGYAMSMRLSMHPEVRLPFLDANSNEIFVGDIITYEGCRTTHGYMQSKYDKKIKGWIGIVTGGSFGSKYLINQKTRTNTAIFAKKGKEAENRGEHFIYEITPDIVKSMNIEVVGNVHQPIASILI